MFHKRTEIIRRNRIEIDQLSTAVEKNNMGGKSFIGATSRIHLDS